MRSSKIREFAAHFPNLWSDSQLMVRRSVGANPTKSMPPTSRKQQSLLPDKVGIQTFRNRQLRILLATFVVSFERMTVDRSPSMFQVATVGEVHQRSERTTMLSLEPPARAALVTALLFLAAPVDAAPQISRLPRAPKLPPPEGQVIRVSTVAQLFQAASDVRPGGTILVADGHYMMPRYFELRTDDVTLRSQSGDRHKVILDGAESRHGELVGVRACSGVTFADLTIQNIRHNGFKLNSNFGVQRMMIHNCVIHNIWQRGVKGVTVPTDRPEIQPPQGCRIQHCLFYNDRPKRFEDDSTDTPRPSMATTWAGSMPCTRTGGRLATTCFTAFEAARAKHAAPYFSGAVGRNASLSGT